MVVDSTTEIYEYEKLTFFIHKRKVIIRTPFGQVFYLFPNGYWNNKFTCRRMSAIRDGIRSGNICDLNTLAGYTRPGIIWTHTTIEEA